MPGYSVRIAVLTQYKSHSLDRHITTTWRMSTILGNYVTPVPAQQRLGPRWFTGSADAIFQSFNGWFFFFFAEGVCVFFVVTCMLSMGLSRWLAHRGCAGGQSACGRAAVSWDLAQAPGPTLARGAFLQSCGVAVRSGSDRRLRRQLQRPGPRGDSDLLVRLLHCGLGRKDGRFATKYDSSVAPPSRSCAIGRQRCAA